MGFLLPPLKGKFLRNYLFSANKRVQILKKMQDNVKSLVEEKMVKLAQVQSGFWNFEI